jgi:putative CocE/NonD family hydrolase
MTDGSAGWFGAARLLNLMVPMRDGIGLATDVFFPVITAGERRPVLLTRTPYGKLGRGLLPQRFLDAGYIVAMQDVRGRHDSQGEFVPMLNEGPDGYDTIEWLAQQPWSDGRIGTFGGSYSGWTQWAAAKEQPPHLAAMAVSVTAGKFGRQEVWDHGIFMLTALNWLVVAGGGRVLQETWMSDWRATYEHLPMIDMPAVLGRELPAWRDWIAHPGLDDYWKQVLYGEADFAAVEIPTLHVSGWFDGNLPASAWFYEQLRLHSPARERQALVLGPWDHAGAGAEVTPTVYDGYDFGASASVDMGAMQVAWFDRWLRDDVSADVAGSRVFVTGADAWREVADWPTPTREDAWHLRSDGRANGDRAGGALTVDSPEAEPADSYRYDPADPLVLYDNWDLYGHLTNAEVEKREPVRDLTRLVTRADTLVYTSAPLPEALDVIGNPSLGLWAATDGPDTDWFVWLHDVDPEGVSVEVSRGQLRGRFHRSLEHESLLEPGRPYLFDVALHPMAHRFRPGHRLRVVIASSNFPRYDRNLNTDAPLGYGTEMRVATNTVLHDAKHPSRLMLPVLAS